MSTSTYVCRIYSSEIVRYFSSNKIWLKFVYKYSLDDTHILVIFKQEKPINIGYYFAKQIIHTRVQICRFVVDATVKTESFYASI